MKKQILVLIYLLLQLLPGTTSAGDPPTTPFIRIDAEMHSAQIRDISTDANARLLATASYDKTVKIWAADTGKLLKTLRPPVGEGVEGTLRAVALSPDGAIVATGGLTGYSWDKNYSIYLFDVKTGEIMRRISGLTNPVLSLAFSHDGKQLAAGLNNSGGVIIINLGDNKRILEDKNFNGNCFGIDFDLHGNLIASSDEGIIRMYRPDGTTAWSLQTDNGKQIYSVRFSPDGRFFATGYDDLKTVEVRSAANGSEAFILNEPKGKLASVAWSADGQYILAAGNKQNKDGRKLLVKWSARWKNLDELIVLPSKNSITQLLPLKNGLTAFVSRQSGFGVIGADGRRPSSGASGKRGAKKQLDYSEVSITEGGQGFFNPIAAADFQKNHDSFRISPDAGSVLFSYERHGQARAQFDLKTRKLLTSDPPEPGMLPPRFTGNGLDIQNWENSSQPRLNGKPLKNFISREKSFSLSVRHDERGFVFGTQHFLRSYTNKGKLLWKQRIPQVAWDVAISAGDQILAAALDDSTIRWYRMHDGKELYSLYLHPDRKRWILWSPEGYFDHGPGSEGLIGFLVNRGADKASAMVGIDQMYNVFYRPELIDKAIAGEDISHYLKHLANLPQTAALQPKEPNTATAEKTVLEKSRAELNLKQKVAAEDQQQLKSRDELKQKKLSEPDRTGKPQEERQPAGKLQLGQEKQEHSKIEPALENVTADPLKDDHSLPAYEPDASDDPAGDVQNSALASLVNTTTLPPKVRFISKSGSSGTRDFNLKAELCDKGGGIGNVTLFLNSTPIAFEQGGRGLAVRAKSAVQACQNFERVITLAPGRNIISLMALNSGNNIESDRDQVILDYIAAETEKPRLHILTIAVNSYRDGNLRLKHSINDAEGLISMATEKGKALFSGIDTYRLHDEQVTKAKMESIFAEIGSKTRRGDVFLLFMAGHGLTDETSGMYYFLPVNFRYTGQDSVAGQGISMNDFKQFLTGIQAMKTLFLIDTCNSGSFSEAIASRGMTEKTALTKLARTVGRATIAASSKNQVALEGYEGHGVFSYTLLEGMRGKAANRKGEITINHLATFIEETLPELTFKKWGYEQIPQKTLIGSDFPIGLQ